MFYIKKIKRKCGVRGCKNTESYAISKSREMGNSIIVCKECLTEALNTIEEQNKPIEFEKAESIAVEEQVAEQTEEQHEEAVTEINEPVAEEKPKQTRQRKK